MGANASIKQNAMFLKFMSDASRQTMSDLNKRIMGGESHLITRANEELPICGNLSKQYKKLARFI